MALYDLDHHAWLPLGRSGLAREALRWTNIGGDPAPRFGAVRRFVSKGRRPLPPSRRLPSAKMGRGAFLAVIAGWLAAVAVVLALALVLRKLG